MLADNSSRRWRISRTKAETATYEAATKRAISQPSMLVPRGVIQCPTITGPSYHGKANRRERSFRSALSSHLDQNEQGNPDGVADDSHAQADQAPFLGVFRGLHGPAIIALAELAVHL